ncbi:MAG: glycosyltransferase [bacterium]
MQTPKVSVIITTYNRAEFIGDTIKSVLTQTYQDFELIIIDDGSTDNTKSIIDKFNDKRIIYYYQDNKGQNPARNKGMELSNGDYIAHIDSDDTWKNTKLEKQVKILDKFKEIGLVYCGTKLIDSKGRFIRNLKIYDYNGFVLEQLIMFNFLYNGSNTLFRKSCLEKIECFDESIDRMTDWEFYLKFSIFYKFYCVPDYLVFYRIHDTNMSVNYKKYEKNGFKILYKVFKRVSVKNSIKHLKPLAYAMRYRFLAHRCLDLNSSKEIRKYVIKAFKICPSILYKSNIALIFILSFCSKWVLNALRKSRKYTYNLNCK